MVATLPVKHNVTNIEPEEVGDESHRLQSRTSPLDEQIITTSNAESKLDSRISVTRLPDAQDDDELTNFPLTSTYHIYSVHPCHKLITPTSDPSKDRRGGPTLKEQKEHRKDTLSRKTIGLPPIDPDENAFFLHKPYLAFHMPPYVLYLGNSRHVNTPAVLIYQSCFWRSYRVQLGPALAQPGVLDPRGVIAWKHNGGDKKALDFDARKLKGYKVRTWRLWGETGREYVHGVKKIRQVGKGQDPDVVSEDFESARADEVMYLRWISPFSRNTRKYHFHYQGVDFYWKGTGTVKESRTCGMFLRYNHLKLVARSLLSGNEKDNEQREICLGKFTSSVAKQKSGVLKLYDHGILRLVDGHEPAVLEESFVEECKESRPVVAEDDSEAKISRLKKSALYQVIMATAVCMIMGEKEKRHTLMDVILGLAEGGGGAGG
jgi:hypothetical protein